MNDIQRLERLYGAAGRELRSMLLGLDPASYSEIRAEAIRDQARGLVRILNVAVDRWASAAIPRAYAKGARTAKTALEILGRVPVRPPIEDRRRRLIDDLMVILIRANNSIPTTVDRYLAVSALAARTLSTAQVQEFEYAQVAGDVERLAAEAVAQQQSRGKLAAAIRDTLREVVVDDQFIQIGNRMYRMSKYATLVARTTLRDAQTAATLDLCDQYDNDLVEVSDHGTVCEVCQEFEGKIFSRSGRSMQYPLLTYNIPAHPHCEHSVHPTSIEAIEARKKWG